MSAKTVHFAYLEPPDVENSEDLMTVELPSGRRRPRRASKVFTAHGRYRLGCEPKIVSST